MLAATSLRGSGALPRSPVICSIAHTAYRGHITQFCCSHNVYSTRNLVVTMAEPRTTERQLLSVAPMMEWTDLHYRQLARIISRRTWLWTEMVVDKTVLHTQVLDKFLWFPPEQHPIVCQLGGSDPETLAAATRMVAQYGYDEVNLNCGCPSDRVAGAGCFGASLMLQPALVAACMKAMGNASNGIPVTVKCRLGVDEVDSYEQLKLFVQTVSEGSPVRHFIVHARKCFLHGLNPSQNRSVPPLRHEWVYSLARDFPHLLFSLNGGVQSSSEAKAAILYEGPWPTPGHLEGRDQQQQGEDEEGCSGQPASSSLPAAAPACSASSHSECTGEGDRLQQHQQEAAVKLHAGITGEAADGSLAGPSYVPIEGGMLEGVMIGRAAYNDPWGCLADADRAVFGEHSNPVSSRREVLEQYSRYADGVVGKFGLRKDGRQPDPNVRTVFKPLLGLFHNQKGSKRWKNAVDMVLKQDPPSVSYVLAQTLHHIPADVLDSPPHESDVLPTCSFADLAQPGDRAGFNQSLAALRRAAREAAYQPQGKKAAERAAARRAGSQDGGLSAAEGSDGHDDTTRAVMGKGDMLEQLLVAEQTLEKQTAAACSAC